MATEIGSHNIVFTVAETIIHLIDFGINSKDLSVPRLLTL